MNTDRRTPSGYSAYFDFLRIAATLAVILTHAAGQNISSVEPQSYPWRVFTFFKLTTVWAVPMFVMLSGALFLDTDKPLDLKKLYRVNILRILTAFAFWAPVYALENYLKYGDIYRALTMLLEGRYHMWYLFLAVGLYLTVPVFRRITECRKTTAYYLGLCFAVLILIPEALNLCQWLQIPYTRALVSSWKTNLNTVNFSFPVIHTFYFVLGAYLAKHDVPAKLLRAAYAGAVLAFGFLVAVEFLDLSAGAPKGVSFAFPLCTFVISVGLFFFGKYTLGKISLSPRAAGFWRMLAGSSFGVYLAHALVLSQLRDRLGLNTLSFDPIVSVLTVTVLTAGLSFAISRLLHRIPVLKKYIV